MIAFNLDVEIIEVNIVVRFGREPWEISYKHEDHYKVFDSQDHGIKHVEPLPCPSSSTCLTTQKTGMTTAQACVFIHKKVVATYGKEISKEEAKWIAINSACELRADIVHEEGLELVEPAPSSFAWKSALRAHNASKTKKPQVLRPHLLLPRPEEADDTVSTVPSAFRKRKAFVLTPVSLIGSSRKL